MTHLPQSFLDRMKTYLSPEDFAGFCSCYDRPHLRGIRLNTLKCTPEILEKHFGGRLRPSPFSPLSYYLDDDFKVGTDPMHSAGAYYSQEPSASSAVTVLDPHPGDKILDMCAAPGGKSTQTAALLGGRGLLFSNEVVRSRANLLLSNTERMGIRNAVITSVYPDQLAEKYEGYFDKVLVDAPCSGEGMFRRDDVAVSEWSPEHVESCAVRQRQILDSACRCVKNGGILVYSTCTFSKAENEDTVEAFLKSHSDFELVPLNLPFGRGGLDGMPVCRIFPMDGGEGHFVAKFVRKAGASSFVPLHPASSQKADIKASWELLRDITDADFSGSIEVIKDKVYIIPEEMPDVKGITVLRAGVQLGEIVKSRIEPHHSLFTALSGKEVRRKLDFKADDRRLLDFLHGLETECEEKGYTAVCVNGITLGFGKASGGVLKNKYPKGLRYH